MDPIPAGLELAAARARDRLAGVAWEAATAGAAPGGPGSAGAMAAAARAAIFADALLGAMHARLEEVKAAAR
jgi:hypothetical protein